MNRENVLKVADVIADLPYEVNVDKYEYPEAFNMASGCGSACCVGGWACWIFSLGGYTLAESQRILGLNSDQAKALFQPGGFTYVEWAGRDGAQVLRLMAAAGDGVTGKRIRAFWRNPWA